MLITPDIAVGSWYQRPGTQVFEVVALDEARGIAHVQYFDGALEEIELEDWLQLPTRSVAPPEDWSGSLDVEPADYGVDREEHHSLDWNHASPLDQLDQMDLVH